MVDPSASSGGAARGTPNGAMLSFEEQAAVWATELDVELTAIRETHREQKALASALCQEAKQRFRDRCAMYRQTLAAQHKPGLRSGSRGEWVKKLKTRKGRDGITRYSSDARNLEIIFAESEEFKGKIALNELSHQIVVLEPIRLAKATGLHDLGQANERATDRHVTEHDYTPVVQFLQHQYDMLDVSEGMVERALSTEARRWTYHPVRKYLAAVYKRHGHAMSTSDAEALVYGFLERHCGARDASIDTETGKEVEHPEVTQAKSRVMLLSAVARVLPAAMDRQNPKSYGLEYRRPDASAINITHGPGCMVKQMVVLQGRSNLGKSSLIQALSPDRSWVSEEHIDFSDTKKAIEVLAGKWLGEYPEFDQALKWRASAQQCKQFISKHKDKFRPAYARHAVDVERQFAIFGTMNPLAVLNDDSVRGEISRFLVVSCGVGWDKNRSIDTHAIAQERDLIWAAAVKLYIAGAIWWVDRQRHEELAQQLIDVQAQHEVEDNYEEAVLRTWLDRPVFRARDWEDCDHIPLEVIVENAFARKGEQNTWSPGTMFGKNITTMLRRMGWDNRPMRSKEQHARYLHAPVGRTFRPWWRPQGAPAAADPTPSAETPASGQSSADAFPF